MIHALPQRRTKRWIGEAIMPRPLRVAHPGDYFHVVNHGQAHAPLFETAADSARLLSLLRWATLKGWIRVLAYAILATHFHLILQTVDGRLDYAMQRVEGEFGRWRNRTRDRVGHVVKGRYHARCVLPGIDLAVALAYVDWNPVEAEMTTTPDAYPHGSAHAYVNGGGPSWLARAEVESLICEISREPKFEGRFYPKLWTWARKAHAGDLAARARRGRSTALADIPLLASAGPEHVQRWLREHLAREEGRVKPPLLLAPGAMLESARDLTDESGEPLIVGMLAQLCGCSTHEIAGLLPLSQPTVLRRLREHHERLKGDEHYARRAALVVRVALRHAYGALADESLGV